MNDDTLFWKASERNNEYSYTSVGQKILESLWKAMWRYVLYTGVNMCV